MDYSPSVIKATDFIQSVMLRDWAWNDAPLRWRCSGAARPLFCTRATKQPVSKSYVMWLSVFNMTPATLYLRLAPRPNKSSKIGPGCAAAPGFADLKALLRFFFFPTPFLFRVSLLWLLWLYEGGPLLSNTYSLSVARKKGRGDKKPWGRLQAGATVSFLWCVLNKNLGKFYKHIHEK